MTTIFLKQLKKITVYFFINIDIQANLYVFQ
jgi:hypothetical protein